MQCSGFVWYVCIAIIFLGKHRWWTILSLTLPCSWIHWTGWNFLYYNKDEERHWRLWKMFLLHSGPTFARVLLNNTAHCGSPQGCDGHLVCPCTDGEPQAAATWAYLAAKELTGPLWMWHMDWSADTVTFQVWFLNAHFFYVLFTIINPADMGNIPSGMPAYILWP